MTWLVILLIFLAAFGPLLWFLPSSRDRRLNRLRRSARNHDLTVEMGRMPKLDPTAEDRVNAGGRSRSLVRFGAVYWRGLPHKLRHLTGARLFRAGTRAAIAAADGWVFDPDFDAPLDWWPRVAPMFAPVLETTDESIVGIEFDRHRVGFYWTERVQDPDVAVAELSNKLDDFAALLARADGVLAGGDDDP